MIKLSQIVLLFRDHLYAGVYRSNYDFFDALYDSFFASEEVSRDYYLHRSSMSRWCNGKQSVSPSIVRYYARPGYDLVLATTIEERFAPYMDDFGCVADQLYNLVCLDQQLKPNEKRTMCNGYVQGDIGTCAEFAARVLIYTMLQGPVVDDHQAA